MSYLLAIDQGTTSTRSIIFDSSLTPVASAQHEIRQLYPAPGLVEHNPEEIWATVISTARAAMVNADVTAKDIAAIGITNQRETTVLWDRKTGRPIHNAIVWQDRRTADRCARLRSGGHEVVISERTGLVLDPYFSATKISWILDNIAGAREAAIDGRLAFGTIDSFLLWRLTGGATHATDATNASRTLLLDITRGQWDLELAAMFDVPTSLLPDVRDCATEFGHTQRDLLGGAIRICGVAGDQQAATVGQGCFTSGMIKSTYGTGCFALLNVGESIVRSRHKLLTTIAYQLSGKRTFALEGAIFVAGAAVQWLRDGLKIISQASDADALALKANSDEQVYLVPAFVGLGAPYWDANARGAIFGLTRNCGAAELARATLESVGYQTRDMLEAMHADWPARAESKIVLRVDGGMSASDVAMQFLSDILDAPVDRPVVMETTALGAAYLAGYQAGICPGPAEFAKSWKLGRRFEPRLDAAARARKWAGWRNAVRRTLSDRHG